MEEHIELKNKVSRNLSMYNRDIPAGVAAQNINGPVPREYGSMNVGLKKVEDAVYTENMFSRANPRLGEKNTIVKALATNDYKTLREASALFFETSGIYSRVCKYLAHLYRYDWYVTPEIHDKKTFNAEDEKKSEKLMKDFESCLRYLDNSYIAKTCGDIALKVLINGCYFGYQSDEVDGVSLQELPIDYCRVRYYIKHKAVVEFNMKYFDDTFKDAGYRDRIIALFPKDFAEGYRLFKEGKLVPDRQGDKNGWYMLDPEKSVKFNCNGSDFPFLANAIPAIIDLADAQELDRKKTMQKLLKIFVQQLPLDKNGELLFDIDEAADLHNNAVQMMRRAVGVDVLTTFADTDLLDMSDADTATSSDDLEKVERGVYNEFGVSHSLFNSDSNLALSNSILDDEAAIRSLPQQFEIFYNSVAMKYFSNKKYSFRFSILETTIFNYKDMSKLYKDQTQIGFSKMLPQIALGHKQSEILSTIHFENDFLNLPSAMIPPLMSSTMSSEDVLSGKRNQGGSADEGGRPELADTEKSDKTLANQESI